MSWYPAGLEPLIVSLARSIDQRFQLKAPNGPVRLPDYTTAELSLIVPTNFVTAFNTTTGKPVYSKLNAGGTAFEWVYADGTAV